MLITQVINNSFVYTTATYSEDVIQSKLYANLTLQQSLTVLCVMSVEGCKTYKKTLTERSKHMSTPVKRKKQLRSLKQRVGYQSFVFTNHCKLSNYI